MAAVLTQIQTTLTQLSQCAVSSPRQPLNSTAIFFDARLPLYSHVPSSQQTVILNGITTSACGLDIACVCRDDEFLTSLQSDLATSCDRHDQASKLLPHPLGIALRAHSPIFVYLLAGEGVTHQTLCFSASGNSRAPSSHELPLTRLAIATFSVAKDLCLTAIPSLAESRGGELVATVTILMVIATLAVILRLYARKISGTKLGTDDYMIVVALVCFLCLQEMLHLIDEAKLLTYGLDINSYYGTVLVITLLVLCS